MLYERAQAFPPAEPMSAEVAENVARIDAASVGARRGALWRRRPFFSENFGAADIAVRAGGVPLLNELLCIPAAQVGDDRAMLKHPWMVGVG